MVVHPPGLGRALDAQSLGQQRGRVDAGLRLRALETAYHGQRLAVLVRHQHVEVLDGVAAQRCQGGCRFLPGLDAGNRQFALAYRDELRAVVVEARELRIFALGEGVGYGGGGLCVPSGGGSTLPRCTRSRLRG